MNTVVTEPGPVGCNVPVAFIIFNRPDVTRQTFKAIAQARPTKLFLISDGPRPDRPGEAERVRKVREIVRSINWPCEVFENFADGNLGCKNRVSSGLTWVFEHADRAIILEDDCLPAPSFFEFCEKMLDLYETDRRVYSISGSNFSDKSGLHSHGFSRYSLMWGWATWANRWSDYVLDPPDYNGIVARVWWNKPLVMAYWMLIYRRLVREHVDTWDYQWILTLWRHNALCCRPSLNLVKNLGFGEDATHTFDPENHLAKLEALEWSLSYNGVVPRVEPDEAIETVDELRWAQISLRSVFGMAFPWLQTLKSTLLKMGHETR